MGDGGWRSVFVDKTVAGEVGKGMDGVAALPPKAVWAVKEKVGEGSRVESAIAVSHTVESGEGRIAADQAVAGKGGRTRSAWESCRKLSRRR